MNECNKQESLETNKVSRKRTRYDNLKGFLDGITKYTVLILTFPLEILGAILKKVFGFVDENKLIPRIALLVGVLLTLWAFQWAFTFLSGVTIAQLSGTEVAAVIGAILTPIAGLITILIRYGSGNGTDKEDPKE